MTCMEQELLSILPPKFRPHISPDILGKLQEIRLRCSYPPVLVLTTAIVTLKTCVKQEDLLFCINTASKYSPWNAGTMKDGYLTAPGGHRIGISGLWVNETVRELTSLNIRVARDIQGISAGIPLHSSILLIGPPGSGKTTLLRELIRRISGRGDKNIAVVDQREEIFPRVNGTLQFNPGPMTDVLAALTKSSGIDMALRTMGPDWIAVDEITEERDCSALVQAAWCGVQLIATAHASKFDDLLHRPVYQLLTENDMFPTIVVLNKNKTWHLERMGA